MARYRLTNLATQARSATLVLALRPFQVNPPSQFLNLRGGTATVGSIARAGDIILVDGRPRLRLLGPQPDHGLLAAFAAGDPVRDVLDRGLALPAGATEVEDPQAAASAAVSYALTVPAGGMIERGLAVALPDGVLPPDPGPDAAAWSAARQSEAEAGWRTALGQVELSGPPAAADLLLTLKAQLGYILVNRAGAAIQPGTRAYARSWIRDGALTGEALLRLGETAAARRFPGVVCAPPVRQRQDPLRGRRPRRRSGARARLDRRVHLPGGRGLPLHRRPGPAAAPCGRGCSAGIAYLESLLDERRTDEYLAVDRREFYGILPPSISHEGYSAKPMHSYWDDFFAARGTRTRPGWRPSWSRPGPTAWAQRPQDWRPHATASWATWAARWPRPWRATASTTCPAARTWATSIATSTTIALAPAEVEDLLPPGALERTFARYWEFFAARRGGEPWEAYTPYELRNVGANVRLGHREHALAMLDFFLGDRRPAGWRHWAEVVRHDAGTAHFLGDMPHTWVGSDCIRSVLDMFAYAERTDTADAARLVLAAGIPAAWLDDDGIAVVNLPTPFGPLTYSLRRAGDDLVLELAATCVVPPGGIVLRPPAAGLPASVDGRAVPTGAEGEVRLEAVPAVVVWSAGG